MPFLFDQLSLMLAGRFFILIFVLSFNNECLSIGIDCTDSTYYSGDFVPTVGYDIDSYMFIAISKLTLDEFLSLLNFYVYVSNFCPSPFKYYFFLVTTRLCFMRTPVTQLSAKDLYWL